MPIKESPIPTKPANFNYPMKAVQAGSGGVQAHMLLGWSIVMIKNISLLNIVCPSFAPDNPLQNKAARVVQTITELWLKTSREGLIAHIHHPGNDPHWCVGDIHRLDSGDSLAQLLWHNDLAALYPHDPPIWADERLHGLIASGCKMLNVKPGDIEDTDDSPCAADLEDDTTE